MSYEGVWCRRAKWSVNSLAVGYSACLMEICGLFVHYMDVSHALGEGMV